MRKDWCLTKEQLRFKDSIQQSICIYSYLPSTHYKQNILSFEHQRQISKPTSSIVYKRYIWMATEVAKATMCFFYLIKVVWILLSSSFTKMTWTVLNASSLTGCTQTHFCFSEWGADCRGILSTKNRAHFFNGLVFWVKTSQKLL